MHLSKELTNANRNLSLNLDNLRLLKINICKNKLLTDFTYICLFFSSAFNNTNIFLVNTDLE